MPLAEFFQTTATINTGNSGGPMFSMAGEVIGVVSHNISKSGGSEGLGFVVTMKSARYFLMEREWAWIGLEGDVVTGEMAEVFNVPGGSGLLGRCSSLRRQRFDLIAREWPAQVRERPPRLKDDGRLVVHVMEEENALVEG